MNPDTCQHIVYIVEERVRHARIVRARIGAAVNGTISIVAIVGFVQLIKSVIAQAAQSGFWSYVSLIASDGSHIAVYWKEFAVTIAESAPIMGFAALLAILVVFVYAARRSVRDTAFFISRQHYMHS